MVHSHEDMDRKSSSYAPLLLVDPKLLESARKIYTTYHRLHKEVARNPLGVAVNRKTYRGHMVFKKPILLPGECFIPTNQLEL